MKTILFTAPILCLAFLAILFLQSGLDKVFNYQGNKEWLQSHFAKSPLKKTVDFLMPMITLLEVASGVCCAVGIVMILINGNAEIGLLGAQLSAVSILALFFGQRVAQDYVGAATLTTYFIISIMTNYLLWDMIRAGY
ncbi:DoxX family membrane protein [Ekhidna sp.]|uniref:DoxX family membrane protein n=1 Tax=Ekhidna sp. TaxID=2608089 RepID=UPI003299C8DE